MNGPLDDLPYLTRDLAPVGGRTARGDDFEVEEIPAYTPSGEGEHLWLWIEKRGLPTPAAVRRIADRLGVRPNEAGYAGLKDADARTRQWLSVPATKAVLDRAAGEWDVNGVTVLDMRRHANKLRLGHLAGNRFRVRIEAPVNPEAAAAVADRLRARGVPNWFGPQRFGLRDETHRIGEAIVAGRFDEAWARIRPDRPATGLDRREFVRRTSDVAPAVLRLYVSAFQAWIFNRALAADIDAIDRAAVGLYMQKHDNRACFRPGADELADAAARTAAGLISPTAPLPGWETPWSSDAVGEAERAHTAQFAADLAGFKRPLPGTDYPGERRALRFVVPDLTVSADERGLLLAFSAPAGAYAVALTREFTREW